MKKMYLILLSILLLTAVESSAQQKFVGKYTYSENLGKTASGTGIVYVHSLIIYKENGRYKAKYNLDGYQLMRRLECSVVEVKLNSAAPASSLIIRFEKYAEGPGSKNPNLYKPQQKLLEISPKGGMMAKPKEKDIDAIFMTGMTSDKQVGKMVTFERKE